MLNFSLYFIMVVMKTLTTLLASFVCLVCIGQNTIDQAKSLFEAKKYDEARKILKAVDDDSKQYAAAQYYLGRIAFNEKDYDAAEDYLEEAVDADDKVADYHYWLGSTLGTIAGEANAIKQGMLASQIKDEFEKTVALKPDYLDAHWGLIEFYTQAPGIMGGSYDKALATAKVIAKYNEADGHRAMGVVYYRQEKFAEAEKEYILAHKTNPTYTGPITTFYINRKEFDKAFTFLEGASKADPNNYALIYAIGRTSAVSGQNLDRGLECLNKYLAYQPKPNEPSHAGAHMRIGQIMEKKGDKAEARKRYEIAIKGDPTLKDAKDGLARVSK